jgi:hypothetical protein
MKIKPNIRAGQAQTPDPTTINTSTTFTAKKSGIKPIKTAGGRCAGY